MIINSWLIQYDLWEGSMSRPSFNTQVVVNTRWLSAYGIGSVTQWLLVQIRVQLEFSNSYFFAYFDVIWCSQHRKSVHWLICIANEGNIRVCCSYIYIYTCTGNLSKWHNRLQSTAFEVDMPSLLQWNQNETIKQRWNSVERKSEEIGAQGQTWTGDHSYDSPAP